MRNQEPEVYEHWDSTPRIVVAGAVLSGAVSARQYTFDRGAHAGARIYVEYSLNASTSVNGIVVSAESVAPIPQFLNSSGASQNLPSAGYGTEQFYSIPASGTITLHNLVFVKATTSGASAVGGFWVPAFPIQGRFCRLSIGVSGTTHASDAVSAYVGLCYV